MWLLGTAVIILSQRRAVLVAKQVAEVDVLSGGWLCLGVGRNPVDCKMPSGERKQPLPFLLRGC